MLDMGFIPDIETICTRLPSSRQTLLFSATMPPPIKKLADRFLSNPKYIEVARPATANINIAQAKIKVASKRKRDLLCHLLREEDIKTAIVFCNRKTTVRELAKSLKRHGFAAGEIHGDMDQPARLAELQRFKDGNINILVASDVAARGLDIKGVSHVFNFDTPWHPDDYVHRIGRTGRAGASGKAFTFVTDEDAEAIANVEKLTGAAIPQADVTFEDDSADHEAREGGARRDKANRPAKRGKEGRKPEGRPPEDRKPEERGRVDRDTTRRKAGPRMVDEQGARPAMPAGRDEPRDEPPGKPGVWNGPVPAFLHVSIGE